MILEGLWKDFGRLLVDWGIGIQEIFMTDIGRKGFEMILGR